MKKTEIKCGTCRAFGPWPNAPIGDYNYAICLNCARAINAAHARANAAEWAKEKAAREARKRDKKR